MNRPLVALLLAALALACSEKKSASGAPAPPAPAPAPQDQAAAHLADGGDPEADVLKPVYSDFEGAALPLAQKLCDALYEIPEARKAACCKSGRATVLTPLCATTLSAALRSKGVSLDPGAVDRCVAAQTKAHDGCSWVGPTTDPLPPECRLLLKGLRKTGEVCRSSLECGDGQHCLGVGPMDPGRCGPPRPDGQACRESVDPLAVYSLEYDEDSHHGECAGYCGHRKCEPAAPLHAKCSLAHQCAAGLYCNGEQCVKGDLPKVGDRCLEECAFGARCVSGKCREPGADGAACTSDDDCRGGCLATTHVCGMRCGGR